VTTIVIGCSCVCKTQRTVVSAHAARAARARSSAARIILPYRSPTMQKRHRTQAPLAHIPSHYQIARQPFHRQPVQTHCLSQPHRRERPNEPYRICHIHAQESPRQGDCKASRNVHPHSGGLAKCHRVCLLRKEPARSANIEPSSPCSYTQQQQVDGETGCGKRIGRATSYDSRTDRDQRDKEQIGKREQNQSTVDAADEAE
jgi:hypothetical protein